MSGETEDQVSGWTTDTLHAHIIDRFRSLDKLLDERKAAQETAVAAALLAQEKAVLKAETAADKRFELLNELRAGVATKEQIDALEKQLNAVQSRLDRGEGRLVDPEKFQQLASRADVNLGRLTGVHGVWVAAGAFLTLALAVYGALKP